MWWFSLEDSFRKGEDHICQLANKLFFITPHAAGCERIWSRLGWYYGKRRTRLSLGKVENMQKLSSFYLSNLKNELPYFSVGKPVEDLHDILCNTDFYDDEIWKRCKLLKRHTTFSHFQKKKHLELKES